MRLPEKALELNFCAQFTELVRPRRALWFGLTQRQEAQWGFDASSNLGRWLIFFQFKALEKINERLWRCHALHEQLLNLQRLSQKCRSEGASVFYAFPLISGDEEFLQQPQLLPKTWLLDVEELPAMPPPRRKDGKPAKEGKHVVEVRIEKPDHTTAYIPTIHQHFQLRRAENLANQIQESCVPQDSGERREDSTLTTGKDIGVQTRLPLTGIGVLLW
jgi:hypothetical protein